MWFLTFYVRLMEDFSWSSFDRDSTITFYLLWFESMFIFPLDLPIGGINSVLCRPVSVFIEPIGWHFLFMQEFLRKISSGLRFITEWIELLYLSTAIKTNSVTFRLRLSFFRHRNSSKKVEWNLSLHSSERVCNKRLFWCCEIMQDFGQLLAEMDCQLWFYREKFGKFWEFIDATQEFEILDRKKVNVQDFAWVIRDRG